MLMPGIEVAEVVVGILVEAEEEEEGEEGSRRIYPVFFVSYVF